jgi:hypothetical protein
LPRTKRGYSWLLDREYAFSPLEAAVRGMTDRNRLKRMRDRVLNAAGWAEVLATP